MCVLPVDIQHNQCPSRFFNPREGRPVAPVVQVVNLEFYLCLSRGFEPQVGRTFDFIYKNKNKKDSIVESALQRG